MTTVQLRVIPEPHHPYDPNAFNVVMPPLFFQNRTWAILGRKIGRWICLDRILHDLSLTCKEFRQSFVFNVY